MLGKLDCQTIPPSLFSVRDHQNVERLQECGSLHCPQPRKLQPFCYGDKLQLHVSLLQATPLFVCISICLISGRDRELILYILVISCGWIQSYIQSNLLLGLFAGEIS